MTHSWPSSTGAAPFLSLVLLLELAPNRVPKGWWSSCQCAPDDSSHPKAFKGPPCDFASAAKSGLSSPDLARDLEHQPFKGEDRLNSIQLNPTACRSVSSALACPRESRLGLRNQHTCKQTWREGLGLSHDLKRLDKRGLKCIEGILLGAGPV